MKQKVLKPFDLEKVKNGAELYTRDGHKARIICFDAGNTDYPIIALVDFNNGKEEDYWYTNNGRRFNNNCTSVFDLMIVEYEEEKHQFEPFEQVLVRNRDSELWQCSIYSHYDDAKFYKHRCIYTGYSQCITFKGNEHLLGTNKNSE